MMAGPLWWETSGRCRKCWLDFRGSCDRKGQTCVCRGYFQGGGSGGSSIWVGDVGDDPPHGPDTGVFP